MSHDIKKTLYLLRNRFLPTHTIGQLYDGATWEFLCFVLEDIVREVEGEPVERWKVQNETAIPYGTYRLSFENSPKFGKDTLTLHDVPGFKNIRIHSGNTSKDTEGCLIVGSRLDDKTQVIYPGSSRGALLELKGVVQRGGHNVLAIPRVKLSENMRPQPTDISEFKGKDRNNS